MGTSSPPPLPPSPPPPPPSPPPPPPPSSSSSSPPSFLPIVWWIITQWSNCFKYISSQWAVKANLVPSVLSFRRTIDKPQTTVSTGHLHTAKSLNTRPGQKYTFSILNLQNFISDTARLSKSVLTADSDSMYTIISANSFRETGCILVVRYFYTFRTKCL